ncbi:Na(+)/H(+) exchange regulatory cofactor NHE-RF3, partial [Ophiophagus hannah]
MSLLSSSEPEGASQIRFCLLKKGAGDNLGFSLCQEAEGMCPIVRKVTPGGLAYRRGLRDGDRILEVNGIQQATPVLRPQRLERFGLQRVSSRRSYLGKPVVFEGANLLPSQGFLLMLWSFCAGVTGVFQLSVLQDGPAHKAGVPHGSWLVELNGVSVKNWTIAQLNQKLKQSSSPVGLLVMDSRSEEAYRQCSVKVTAALADASWVPFQVTKLQMMRGEDGYGDLEAGLPAEKAGMREGDCLLAVNGEIVEDLDHQEVVSRIRSDNQRVTLLVIDSEGSKFYNMVPKSSLLLTPDGKMRRWRITICRN